MISQLQFADDTILFSSAIREEVIMLKRTLNRRVASLLGREGGCIFFIDDWVEVGPLYVLYPRMSRVVSKREFAVNDCYV